MLDLPVKFLKDFNDDYEELINVLISFLRRNDKISKKYIETFALYHLYNVSPKEYILNHSDQDNFLVINHLITQEFVNEEEIIKEVVYLIWEIITYMTDEVCPSCFQTNLRLYTDRFQQDVYEMCVECFACRKGEDWIHLKQDLYPATKYLVTSFLSNSK